MSKKLRAKDLAHDQVRDSVVNASEIASAYAKAHRGPLLIAAIAIVAVGVGWSLVQLVAERRSTAQQSALGAAVEKERLALQPASATTVAPTVTLEDARAAFAGVMTEHPGTTVAALAALHLGTVELRMGRPADAAKTLSALVEGADEDWVTPHALMALATAQEEVGDGDAARATVDRLAAGTWRSLPKSMALLRTAELAERQGRTDDAISGYQKLADDSGLAASSEAGLAKQALQRLGASSGT